ncbi:hypothetical protein CW751_10450 [Brumimicrobium salinarum]|uniref:Uncharacterized protein n=1 Tax=Brumimicrobium salinarum TaxID=2058658 RepID=A0A2I0R103_9FLAO|nr:hypothetical protein [Brumimicrobium salinarum]PKR80266.1 hypothetical protein CW751_10450 [Brumimicrobium salinarum]
MEDHVKNIILEKKWFELTMKERMCLKDWAQNEEEFDALKLTFLSAEELRQENRGEKVSPSVKHRLDERFAQKHVHKKELWLNRVFIFFFPKDVAVYKKPAFQLVMVALLVVIAIPFLWQKDTPRYAMSEKHLEIEIWNKEKEVQKSKSNSAETKTTSKMGSEDNEIPVPEITPEEQQPGFKIKSFEKLEEPILVPLNADAYEVETEIHEDVEIEIAEQIQPEIQSLKEVQGDFSKKRAVEKRKKQHKHVNPEETLDLLTVLY